jgi:Mlc titration factor MtfA (ptsG expression regulator)
MFGFKQLRRKRLMRHPLPPEWLEIIRRNVPYFQNLPEEKQNKLGGLVQIFLDEKLFEGCGGLSLTDEMRVTIAAQACILLLGSPDLDVYPNLRSILVYPDEYFAPVREHREGGVVEEGVQSRIGEAWSRGNIVLAWDAVKHGASDVRDGQNLVFHEFAHQIDYEYGATEQVGNEDLHSSYLAWARVLSGEYQRHVHDTERRHRTLMDEYGATSLAEFFAVATEYFFEKPVELQRRHPELYEQLRQFYGQDPADYRKQ